MISMPKKDASPLFKAALHLNGSFRHRTGERLLAGLGDGRAEHFGVRAETVPGLLR